MAGKRTTPSNTPATERAEDVKPEAINWLWPVEGNLPESDDNFRPGRIPGGMLTVIGGRPGRGKSMASAYFAADVSNRKTQRNGVLLNNMEDPVAQVLRPRLEAAGANLHNVHFFNFVLPKDDLGIEQQVEMLRSMIYALNIGLIICDPIAACLAVSLYNDQEVRRVLSPLTKMLAETGTAMLAIAHVNKHISKNADPQAAFGGSGGGLMGAARAAYAFDRDPSDETVRVMASVKFNLGPEPEGSIAFDMESEEWRLGSGKDEKVIRTGKLAYLHDAHPATAQQILTGKAEGDDGVPAEKKAIAAEWVTAYLVTYRTQQGEWPAAKVVREDAAEEGISLMTLKRASQEVGVVKARKGFGPGSYIEWSLPDDHPDMQQLSLTGATAGADAADGDDDTPPEPVDMSQFEAALEAAEDDTETEGEGTGA
jgi:AAA domain